MKRYAFLSALFFYFGCFVTFANEKEDLSASPSFSGLLARHFSLRGYAHILYQYDEKQEVESKFTAQRAIVIANGLLTDQLDYLLMYDFGMNSMLHELWLRYKISPALEITAGQQKVPTTLESIISPSILECIRMSMVTTNLVGIGKGTDVINADKSNAGRDLGVQLSGKVFPYQNHHLLHYRMGIFNGSGINVADNNNHKDFAAWLHVYPVKEWCIGGSVYLGKGHYQAVGEFENADHTRNRYCLTTELKLPAFYIRSEGILGKDGEFDRDGFYITGLYHLQPEKLDLMLRYDYYNNHENKSSLDILPAGSRQLNWIKSREYTIGINYNFYPLNRLQIQYTFRDRLADGQENASLFLAQLQIGF